MATLTPVPGKDSVYQIETTDLVQGGAGGIANDPHQNLVNNIEYIIEAIEGTTPNTDVWFAEGTAPSVVLHETDASGVGSAWRMILNGSDVTIEASSDGSTDFSGGTIAAMSFLETGVIIVNRDAASVNFNVRGDTDANLIYVDGSQDNVGFGKAPAAGYFVDISGTGFSQTMHIDTDDDFAVYSSANTYSGYFASDGTARTIQSGSTNISADTTDNSFNIVTDSFTTTGIVAGSIIKVLNFSNDENNGYHEVVSITSSKIVVTTNLTTESAGNNIGIYEYSVGVFSKGYYNGLIGMSTSDIVNNAGVVGVALSTSASSSKGVFGSVLASGASGVYGESRSAGNGIYGTSYGSTGIGAYGIVTHTTGACVGVKGEVTASSSASSYAVEALHSGSSGYGVYATGNTAVSGNTAYDNRSDKFMKVSKQDIKILDKLRITPFKVQQWLWEDSNVKGFNEFIGPYSQDIKDCFDLTFHDDSMFTVDGIALGGVIELLQELDALKERIQKLESK